MKWFYVGISTLLVTIMIGAVSVIGLQKLLGDYNEALDLTWKIILGVFICLKLVWLFCYIFSSRSLQEAILDWLEGMYEFYGFNWKKLLIIVLVVIVGVCFVIGAGHLTMEVYKNFAIAKDAERFILSKVNPLQEKLAMAESQIRVKDLKIADLESKVRTLSEENIKLRETIKKASRS